MPLISPFFYRLRAAVPEIQGRDEGKGIVRKSLAALISIYTDFIVNQMYSL
jgi:hypothetical protein